MVVSNSSGDPGLLVLMSLAGGAKHGYAIVKDVKEQVGVRLGPGTLYGALARLEERGMIRALPLEGRRRPYALTALGAESLRVELERLGRVAEAGLRRLSLAGGAT